jgi:hypothetical protein
MDEPEIEPRQKPVVVAGLGGEQVPEEILELMEAIGDSISKRSWWLRSGHSLGGDYAFERGAKGRSIIYIPHRQWAADREYIVFNKEKQVIRYADLHATNNELWEQARTEIQKNYHNSWKSLNGHAKSMLCRIYILMLGASEEAIPVDALICYFKKKKKDEKEPEDIKEEYFGGPEVAIKIADDYDIPIVNLAEKFYIKLFETGPNKGEMDIETTVTDILRFLERSVDTRDYYVEEKDIDMEELARDIEKELAISTREIMVAKMARADYFED